MLPGIMTVEQMAMQAADILKTGELRLLRDAPKKSEEALSEYLEYQFRDLDKKESARLRQAIHSELVARNVFKSLSLAEAPDDRTSVVNDFRYSRFDIRQEFAEGFDPDRIAAAFATDLGKLADHKLRAASPIPAGAH